MYIDEQLTINMQGWLNTEPAKRDLMKGAEMVLKLQQDYGYKPTAGCVPMLLNFLVIFGVIGVVYNPPGADLPHQCRCPGRRR